MNTLKKKLNKNGGFTLVEMLIVVAIIAILIAISIPLISSSLESSRHATDDANRRDAISVATVYYLTHMNDTGDDAVSFPTDAMAYTVVNSQGTIEGSGEPVVSLCTNDTTNSACEGRVTKGTALQVKIDADGNVTTSWDADWE